MKPFLKWPGNKFRILNEIKQHLPAGKRLIEPFAGTAAISLNTNYAENLIAEKNPDLINLYQCIQKEGEVFIRYVKKFFTPENNQEERYYELRDKFNKTSNKRLRSALFLYFNKHGYNGLCRYNSSGGFNVPFGRYKKTGFPAEELMAFHQKSKIAKFIEADFQQTMKQAVKGDVVYCDPPYVPLSEKVAFTTYSKGGFNDEQQIQLAECAETLAKKGIPVVVSNHDTPFSRELYHLAEIHSIQVQRTISCNSSTRGMAPELIAVYSAC